MTDTKFIAEGGSSHRPPYFNGSDYYYWKGKMRLFLLSQDNNMCYVVENGNYTPMTSATDTIASVPKTQSQWTKEENDKVLLNSKAQFILSCALSREEYDRIEECTTAKEIWDALKIHHKGTNHVKEERIDLGVRKFETFEMKEEETIDEMFSRFTVIVNELRSLGKAYTAHERIRKILRCLPKIWRPMVTAISQAKDLKILQVEELIESLRAHEGILNEDKPQRKGKMIALKTSQNSASKITTSQGTTEEDTGFLSEDENDLALISRRIQQMILKRNQNRKSFQPRKEYQKPEIDKSKITCYGCNKLGHFKTECPLKTHRNFSSKKSMLAQWDDSENSNSEAEDEEANLCLMTNSDSEEVEPKNINEALKDESWMEAMTKELSQFEKSQVWKLVPYPQDKTIIGTRWVFRNKLDENGKVTRNKARLVAQGYNQQEGIDYDETYAPVASRPDIVFLVGLCARFQTDPKESHLTAVKRIFRYLVGTTDIGLWYEKGNHINLIAYCDADYDGDKIERKSTSGACQFLGQALITWSCRKQNTIALSTTEA
ncbi:uncharacterized protein LOC131613765 [Vicia villosa]|uniref:uncharacterized protein LOC131613765 n=1 Tax=Vicia villosa TaxID=3911 RepID=UPI00273B8DD6|nr:uncharacterized protein LOC131613765 [Vicia villosa]